MRNLTKWMPPVTPAPAREQSGKTYHSAKVPVTCAPASFLRTLVRNLTRVPIAYAPTTKGSQKSDEPIKVPIAPATNLARKFLGTSHAHRIRACEVLASGNLLPEGGAHRARAHDQGDSPALPPLQTVAPPEFARHAIEQALISNEGIHAVQHAHDRELLT